MNLPPDAHAIWDDALAPGLAGVWTAAQAQRDELLDRWIKEHDSDHAQAMRQNALQDALGMIEAALSREPAQDARWDDIHSLMAAAWHEAADVFGAIADPAVREARFVETLSAALRGLIQKLGKDVLAKAGREVEAILGDIWSKVLDEIPSGVTSPPRCGAGRTRTCPAISRWNSDVRSNGACRNGLFALCACGLHAAS